MNPFQFNGLLKSDFPQHDQVYHANFLPRFFWNRVNHEFFRWTTRHIRQSLPASTLLVFLSYNNGRGCKQGKQSQWALRQEMKQRLSHIHNAWQFDHIKGSAPAHALPASSVNYHWAFAWSRRGQNACTKSSVHESKAIKVAAVLYRAFTCGRVVSVGIFKMIFFLRMTRIWFIIIGAICLSRILLVVRIMKMLLLPSHASIWIVTRARTNAKSMMNCKRVLLNKSLKTSLRPSFAGTGNNN